MQAHINVKNPPYAFCRRSVLDALRHASEIQTFTILDQYVERFNYSKVQINLKECFYIHIYIYIWKYIVCLSCSEFNYCR
jgi:hypothetical protein